jgi:hypothetical protein
VLLAFKKLKFPVLEVSGADFPKIEAVDVVGCVAEEPNRPPKVGVCFAGAGVEAGVVEAGLAVSWETISVSLDGGGDAVGALAALSRALLKVPPKRDPLSPLDGPASSFSLDLSALKVEPRLKLFAPKIPEGLSSLLFTALLKGLPVLAVEIAPVLGAPKTLVVGFAPNTLPGVDVLSDAEENPPLAAKAAKPPEDGVGVAPVLAVPEPKVEAVCPSPEGLPKAEPGAVEPAVPHGEARLAPGSAELPNAGVEVDPNAGAPVVAGFAPNVEDPKAGAAGGAVVLEVAGFPPKAVEPNAGEGLAEAPNTEDCVAEFGCAPNAEEPNAEVGPEAAGVDPNVEDPNAGVLAEAAGLDETAPPPHTEAR